VVGSGSGLDSDVGFSAISVFSLLGKRVPFALRHAPYVFYKKLVGCIPKAAGVRVSWFDILLDAAGLRRAI